MSLNKYLFIKRFCIKIDFYQIKLNVSFIKNLHSEPEMDSNDSSEFLIDSILSKKEESNRNTGSTADIDVSSEGNNSEKTLSK